MCRMPRIQMFQKVQNFDSFFKKGAPDISIILNSQSYFIQMRPCVPVCRMSY